MANPLLTIIESIRRLGGLRRLAGGFPPVVQLVAALSTVVLVAFSAITFVGGTILGGGDGQDNTPTVTASPSPKDTPSMDATPLPTGSLVVLGVSYCELQLPSNGDSMAQLAVELEIAGNWDFSQQVPYVAWEEDRKWPIESFEVFEDEWVAEDGKVVTAGSIWLQLEADDLRKRHDITIRADPNEDTEAFDSSNSETSFRVTIPATLPEKDQALPCVPVP